MCPSDQIKSRREGGRLHGWKRDALIRDAISYMSDSLVEEACHSSAYSLFTDWGSPLSQHWEVRGDALKFKVDEPVCRRRAAARLKETFTRNDGRWPKAQVLPLFRALPLCPFALHV
jgi:hypothetical protein